MQRISAHEFALRFFITALLAFLAAGGIAFLLRQSLGEPVPDQELRFPPVFWLSSALLLMGSWILERAEWAIRREKQDAFRRSLKQVLVVATSFVGTQAYGLWWLIRLHPGSHDESQLGIRPFLVVVAGLHAMHFVVAMLFVIFILTKAQAGRYDHEYFWGVTVCQWFWHALGILWGLILLIFCLNWVTELLGNSR